VQVGATTRTLIAQLPRNVSPGRGGRHLHMESSGTGRERAEALLLRWTRDATLRGAIMLPVYASIGFVTEHKGMIGAIGSAMGVDVRPESVAASLTRGGGLDRGATTRFVQGARLMCSVPGPLRILGGSLLGARTAGLRTWSLGRLAIAIAEHGGQPLDEKMARAVLTDARDTFTNIRRVLIRQPVEP